MIIVVVFLAGLLVGGGIVGYLLSQKYKREVADAQTEFETIVQQHQEMRAETQALKQVVADLTYQLGEARKDLKAYEARSSEPDKE